MPDALVRVLMKVGQQACQVRQAPECVSLIAPTGSGSGALPALARSTARMRLIDRPTPTPHITPSNRRGRSQAGEAAGRPPSGDGRHEPKADRRKGRTDGRAGVYLMWIGLID